MELIRVKSRLAQPYAGAFLKKDDRYVHHCRPSRSGRAQKGIFSWSQDHAANTGLLCGPSM